jgi:hypothetical protein
MVLKRIWQKLGDTLPTTNDPAPPLPLRCPLVFYEWWGLQAPWSPSRLSSGSSKSRQPPRHLTVFLILVLTWTATAITMQLPCLTYSNTPDALLPLHFSFLWYLFPCVMFAKIPLEVFQCGVHHFSSALLAACTIAGTLHVAGALGFFFIFSVCNC